MGCSPHAHLLHVDVWFFSSLTHSLIHHRLPCCAERLGRLGGGESTARRALPFFCFTGGVLRSTLVSLEGVLPKGAIYTRAPQPDDWAGVLHQPILPKKNGQQLDRSHCPFREE
jgi:hypothetical protein